MKTKIIESAQSAYEHPLLIKNILMSSRGNNPENKIVYQDKVSYDYKTFYQRVCQLANLLKERGIQAGDTVAVLDWDSHRYLECYFAVPMIGAVLHHVNIRLSPEQIVYTMNHAEDKLVLVHDDFVPLIEQVNDHLTTVEQYLLLSDKQSNDQEQNNISALFEGEYEALMSQQGTSYQFPDFDENSIATIFYTTGTTGNPKGVYFSHRQLVLHTLNMKGEINANSNTPLLNADSVYMPLTPMFHVHAWGVPYVATMLGINQVYPGRYEPKTMLTLIKLHQVTFSHCVPTILQMILEGTREQGMRFDGWSVVIGGSALSQAIAQESLDRGIEILTGYGMSETCPLISASILNKAADSLSPEEKTKYRTQAGRPVSMVDIQLMDANGEFLPHDGESVGEIVLRAPWLTQGYFKEPEKGAELWQNGWLHTGDLGSLSSDGVLEIKDRIKDVIKTGGEWISSIELEDLIADMPSVVSVAVIGVPDDEWGERPVAVLVPTEEQNFETEKLRQHLMQYVESGHINKWWIPERVEIVDELPKTSVGKINKKDIRSQLLEASY